MDPQTTLTMLLEYRAVLKLSCVSESLEIPKFTLKEKSNSYSAYSYLEYGQSNATIVA